MNILEMNEIGKFIRKTRKERGLRLEDLSDEHISTATISNIERGVPHVNKEKVLYLMSKLGLELDEIPDMIEKDSESLESMQVRFTAVETLIQLGNIQRAQAFLSDISDESFSRHQATVHFLKGKIFKHKKDWRKAEREFSEAIRLSYQDPYSPKNHLEAVSYHALADCRMINGDWEQALRYLDKGMESVQNATDAEQVRYLLLVARMTCMEKLGRTEEALRGLDELWPKIHEIQNRELVLRMYALKAELLRRMRMHHDAIRYAREGILQTVNGRDYEEMFALWVTLGTAYMEIKQLEEAETCFSFVLELSDYVSNKQEVVRAWCSLGNVYLLEGKLDQARDILKQALDWAEKLGDTQTLITALLMMGQLMKRMKHYADAVEHFQRAVQVALKHKFRQKAYIGFYELAECHEQMGDLEGFKSATEQMYRIQKEMPHDEFLIG
ncbi:helix-turn-helix domain-containing protein [Staphylospora marina]|uniref:helix-turn-helix domain-containing protein n=1 Tax=Staphylospora marina TaxID=2490858 RepID=UPI000F5BB418|nr:tetratricopeptide repeat protein [Staphylospora marina]